jgi:hypothetical protein
MKPLLDVLVTSYIFRKELKRSSDELLDTMREDKREIKDKIDHEYTGIMRMREIKKRLTTNIQVLCT